VALNLSWFVAPFNWCIINIVTLGFCNITAELINKNLCSWPARGAEGPVEKPCSSGLCAFSRLECQEFNFYKQSVHGEEIN